MKDIRITPDRIIPKQNQRTERDKALMKACRDFESVLTYQLLKSMRSTIDKCDLFHGGQGEEIYESLLDQELSKSMGGNGPNSLASALYSQLKRRDRADLEAEIGFSPLALPKRNPPDPIPLRPVEARESSGFGWRRDPFTGERRFHTGIDLAAAEGTPVRASLAGRVVVSEYQEGYGNVVVLDHGKGLTTLYAHHRENLVNVGDWISQGESLGEVGSSGRSTGPHLHFEIRRHGKYLDPGNILEDVSPAVLRI